MGRKYNFSAGPAILPAEVLVRAQNEMLDWRGSGMSVMEMSHRGKEYMSIAGQAETDFGKNQRYTNISSIQKYLEYLRISRVSKNISSI